MKIIKAGPNTIELYDSIMNLPPHRESMMSYYQLMESGVGHDWAGIEKHLNSLLMSINIKSETMAEDVNQEIENMRMNYWLMLSKFNPEHLSFLCLIKSINGEPLDDLSEANLIQLGKRLGEEGDAEYIWHEAFDEIKKKFPPRWNSTLQDQEEMYL